LGTAVGNHGAAALLLQSSAAKVSVSGKSKAKVRQSAGLGLPKT